MRPPSSVRWSRSPDAGPTARKAADHLPDLVGRDRYDGADVDVAHFPASVGDAGGASKLGAGGRGRKAARATLAVRSPASVPSMPNRCLRRPPPPSSCLSPRCSPAAAPIPGRAAGHARRSPATSISTPGSVTSRRRGAHRRHFGSDGFHRRAAPAPAAGAAAARSPAAGFVKPIWSYIDATVSNARIERGRRCAPSTRRRSTPSPHAAACRPRSSSPSGAKPTSAATPAARRSTTCWRRWPRPAGDGRSTAASCWRH